MSANNSKINRVILFYGGIGNPGGEEKLLFEEALYLKKKHIETHILTYRYSTDAYGDAYDMAVEVISNPWPTFSNKVLKKIFKLMELREKIRTINPDIIIAHSYYDSPSLFFATLSTPFAYAIHIPETMFRYHGATEKYAFIHRKVFREIRKSTVGGKEFIGLKPQKTNLIKSIINEVRAIVIYIGVRKAKKNFVLSNQMKWEVKKLYGKDAIVLKGAFPSEILSYKPNQNIKEKLGLTGKRMILNVNRLDPRKRVDLLIKAFKQICDELDDVVLIIGGVGPEEEKLKTLTKELNIEEWIKFVGYIPEEERKDYYACCDVFAHPNWADFAIAPFEALAMQKKVVWSSEMDMDETLLKNKHIFVANPTVSDFARVIKEALATEVSEHDDVSNYTWEAYFEGIMRNISG